MSSEDVRDAEIARLREQVGQLIQAVSALTAAKPLQTQAGGGWARLEERKQKHLAVPNWVALPSGQCIPAWFTDPECDGSDRRSAGFRWEGTTLIVPDDWPKR